MSIVLLVICRMHKSHIFDLLESCNIGLQCCYLCRYLGDRKADQTQCGYPLRANFEVVQLGGRIANFCH